MKREMRPLTQQDDGAACAGTLDAAELIASARAATGLDDFGAPDVTGPLGVLVDALNREAWLTPEGEAGKRASLIRALSNRLRLADALRRNPEIEQQVITKPIFVVGLQRTGTTKLHRVIAADPAIQKLPLWRLLEPVPAEPIAPGGPDPRLARAEAFVEAARTAAPDAYAAHPMYAAQADEEVFVMEIAFLANINATAFRSPSFEAWLNAQSFESWYAWFRKLLQYIQFTDGTEGRPWVLKAPHHLGFMPLLFDHFPDATVVHAHRDPLVAVPSFASLALASRSSTSSRPDAHETGRYCLDYCGARIQTYVDDRDALDREAQFVDVSYRDIVSDAESVVERVYAAAGITLTDAARAAIRAWEGENEQHKHGRHSYGLADFGLDRDEATALFKDYARRFADYL